MTSDELTPEEKWTALLVEMRFLGMPNTWIASWNRTFNDHNGQPGWQEMFIKAVRKHVKKFESGEEKRW
jgi:hypothetical protein